MDYIIVYSQTYFCYIATEDNYIVIPFVIIVLSWITMLLKEYLEMCLLP